MQFNYVYYYLGEIVHTTVELEKHKVINTLYTFTDVLGDIQCIDEDMLGKHSFFDDIYEEYFGIVGNDNFDNLDFSLGMHLQMYKQNLEDMIDLCSKIQTMVKEKNK